MMATVHRGRPQTIEIARLRSHRACTGRKRCRVQPIRCPAIAAVMDVQLGSRPRAPHRTLTCHPSICCVRSWHKRYPCWPPPAPAFLALHCKQPCYRCCPTLPALCLRWPTPAPPLPPCCCGRSAAAYTTSTSTRSHASRARNGPPRRFGGGSITRSSRTRTRRRRCSSCTGDMVRRDLLAPSSSLTARRAGDIIRIGPNEVRRAASRVPV